MNKHTAFIVSLLLFFQFKTTSFAQVADPEKDFEFAKKLLTDNLYKLAAEQFSIFVKTFPSHEYSDDALFLSGKAFLTAKLIPEAFESFRRLELSFPQSPYLAEGRFLLAYCQEQLGEEAAAAALYRRVPELHPKSEFAAKSYLASGRCFAKSGEMASALDSYKRLISDYPESGERLDAHIEIINLYLNQKNYEEAAREADGIFAAFGPTVKDARVYWIRASIFEQLGQTKEAEALYDRLVQQFLNEPAGRKALLKQAAALRRRGDCMGAIQKYEAALKASEESQVLRPALVGKAECLLDLNRQQEALEAYDSALSHCSASEKTSLHLTIGKLLAAKDNLEKAEQHLQEVLAMPGENKDENSSDIPSALLVLADVQFRMGKHQEALNSISSFKTRFPDHPEMASVIFKEAEIYQKGIGNFSKAIRLYDDFTERYPRHARADEAQYNISSCYTQLGQFQLARQEDLHHLRVYPASDYHERVVDRIFLIDAVGQMNPAAPLGDFSRLLLEAPEHSKTDLEAEVAKVELKAGNFESAIARLRMVRAAVSDAKAIAETELEIAKAFFLFAERNRLLTERNRAKTLLDSANVHFNRAFAGEADSALASDGQLLLANMLNTGLFIISTDSVPRSLEKLMESNNGLNSRLLFALGELYFDSNSDSLAWSQAGKYYRQYLTQGVQPHSDKATLRLILCNVGTQSDSVQIAKLNGFLQTYPESHYRPEALLLRARKLVAIGDTAAAINDYRNIVQRYPYTSAADRAQQKMADIDFYRGDFRSSLLQYDKLLNAGNGHAINRFQRANMIYRQARAQEELGEFSEALATYSSFIQQNSDHVLAGSARLAIANIAAKLGNELLAREYHQSLLRTVSEPSLRYRSYLALGQMDFDKKIYDKSLASFEEARKVAMNASERRFAEQRIIQCLLGLRQFAAAVQKVKAFKRSYQDTEQEEAIFLHDEGHAYLAEKNFEKAEKAFKKLRSDFANTDWGAQGEFGLGALKLITNHTEEALKILTDIPSRYPDSEVTARTYLNLGDFYYKSSQVQNAILAFKKAVQHPKAGEYHEQALLYLIQSYTDVGMWDQAIASTREFLTTYPRSDKAFRKKIDLAQLLMKLREYNRAADNLRQLLPYASPEFEAEIQFYIAQCYKEDGNFERAVSEYLKVKYLTRPSKLPWHVTALFETGKCLIRLNDYEQAAEVFRRIIAEQGTESNFGRFAAKQLQELSAKQVELGNADLPN